MFVQKTPLKAYHSLLPSVSDVQQNRSQFLSDHLPILATIPLENDAQLKIISWNVLNPYLPSGFGIRNETKEEQSAREERSVTALLNMIHHNNPDVIVLQETYFDEKKLREKIYPDYEILNDQQGQFILYKKEILEPSKEIEEKSEDPIIQKAIFKHKQSQKQIMIGNAHFPHAENPEEAEKTISDFIKSDLENIVIVGDFNNRFVPLDTKDGTSLINSVVPPIFRYDNDNIQGADWTDGCFYKGIDKQCHQPATQQLNPETGKTCEPQPLSIDTFDQKQKVELSIQRPFLCCGSEHSIDLNSLFGYALEHAQLEQLGINIGRSSDASNHQMIRFDILFKDNNQDLLEHIKNKLNGQIMISEIYDDTHESIGLRISVDPENAHFVSNCITQKIQIDEYKKQYSKIRESKFFQFHHNFTKNLEGKKIEESYDLIKEHNEKSPDSISAKAWSAVKEVFPIKETPSGFSNNPR
ncbi:MAG: hypothetical protein SFW66_04190 [Gammaproteobacteria bacterium]|nr:hypothetical protein [Gammaproteobacteria bacterium]